MSSRVPFRKYPNEAHSSTSTKPYLQVPKIVSDTYKALAIGSGQFNPERGTFANTPFVIYSPESGAGAEAREADDGSAYRPIRPIRPANSAAPPVQILERKRLLKLGLFPYHILCFKGLQSISYYFKVERKCEVEIDLAKSIK
jgi:hypothetical protein